MINKKVGNKVLEHVAKLLEEYRVISGESNIGSEKFKFRMFIAEKIINVLELEFKKKKYR